MNKTTMNMYCFVLTFIMMGDVAAMEDPQETDPLLSKNSIAARPSEPAKPFDENSALFCSAVDTLYKQFENFSAMPPENQQEILKKWKAVTDCCLFKMQLSNGGFKPRLEISDETTDKLTAIHAIYKSHKKSNGCILQ